MSRIKQFKLPDLGEGLTEGEILQWLVKPGDEVKLNQPIVEVETAKAAVEIPSPYAGVVSELFCGEGDTVEVGAPIIAYDTEPGAGPAPTSSAAPATDAAASSATAAGPAVAAEASAAAGTTPTAEEPTPEAGLIGGPAPGGRTAVLVGYGPRQVAAKRRARKSDALTRPAGPVGVTAPPEAAPPAVPASPAPPLPPPDVVVLAKPPVRKLAKELGVDLRSVAPTGPNGSISRDDVLAASSQSQQAAAPVPAVAPAVAAGPAFGPDREQRIPVKGVRKLTAENTARSAFTAPHVTEFLTIDATRAMRALKRLKTIPGWEERKVSPLLLAAKAVLLAIRRHPMINSTWDEQRGEIVVKEYVNLGIAAATPRGLIVPNVKDAGRLSLRELAEALNDLVRTAKDGRTSPADMQGGTFTITNVGVFGIDTGTPILPPGEAAILAFGAIREQPWVHRGKVKPRQVTTLGLSFDHRIVDGELGSLFLADVGRFLADPESALLAWG
jgi:pyruvate dehydrogenase E2 component (dihydrolipoamide acetyltransferase)